LVGGEKLGGKIRHKRTLRTRAGFDLGISRGKRRKMKKIQGEITTHPVALRRDQEGHGRKIWTRRVMKWEGSTKGDWVIEEIQDATQGNGREKQTGKKSKRRRGTGGERF